MTLNRGITETGEIKERESNGELPMAEWRFKNGKESKRAGYYMVVTDLMKAENLSVN